jgi:metal-responsive CopG/Arc/MetJ family transcriptional regulator
MFLMRTVQMTLEPALLAQIDRAAKRLGLTRSAFARGAFAAALEKLRIQERERRHAAGYRRKPVRQGEFDAWGAEQAWPD